MKDFSLLPLVRSHIQSFTPYSSARDEFSSEAHIFLDANENPFDTSISDSLNRYPDPYQKELKKEIAILKTIDAKRIFLGNGSDEIIDLVIRLFCVPKKDNILLLNPSYGMYKVLATLNEINPIYISLKEDFSINSEDILKKITPNTKIIFLCSPNNPTGNAIKIEVIESILAQFKGLVFVDEAYIDFSTVPSALTLLDNYSHLLVSQTFSKAWGLAGVRLGVSYSHPTLVTLLNKIKPPYNINRLTQKIVMEKIKQKDEVKEWVKKILKYKDEVIKALHKISDKFIVYPSDANFILVKFIKSQELFEYLLNCGIVVRNRSQVHLCNDCLRITIGTAIENKTLLQSIEKFYE